jgi:hypothetical protein
LHVFTDCNELLPHSGRPLARCTKRDLKFHFGDGVGAVKCHFLAHSRSIT